jgi:hypothetical protein
MDKLPGSIVLAMLMSVCGVQHVSGFAQTDIDDNAVTGYSSRSAVRIYVAGRSAQLDDAECAPNLDLAGSFRPLVAELVSRSPTFRRQCARLAAAPHLSILLRSDLPEATGAGALTRIQMRPHGRLEAVVQVGVSARTAELIAHEIEHIIEQLDGIDLRMKSRLRASGVRRVWDLDAYETTRAIATGQRVAREALGRAVSGAR